MQEGSSIVAVAHERPRGFIGVGSVGSVLGAGKRAESLAANRFNP
jgi:hypothetical protein